MWHRVTGGGVVRGPIFSGINFEISILLEIRFPLYLEPDLIPNMPCGFFFYFQNVQQFNLYLFLCLYMPVFLYIWLAVSIYVPHCQYRSTPVYICLSLSIPVFSYIYALSLSVVFLYIGLFLSMYVYLCLYLTTLHKYALSQSLVFLYISLPLSVYVYIWLSLSISNGSCLGLLIYVSLSLL